MLAEVELPGPVPARQEKQGKTGKQGCGAAVEDLYRHGKKSKERQASKVRCGGGAAGACTGTARQVLSCRQERQGGGKGKVNGPSDDADEEENADAAELECVRNALSLRCAQL